jgi:hypothetical protein
VIFACDVVNEVHPAWRLFHTPQGGKYRIVGVLKPSTCQQVAHYYYMSWAYFSPFSRSSTPPGRMNACRAHLIATTPVTRYPAAPLVRAWEIARCVDPHVYTCQTHECILMSSPRPCFSYLIRFHVASIIEKLSVSIFSHKVCTSSVHINVLHTPLPILELETAVCTPSCRMYEANVSPVNPCNYANFGQYLPVLFGHVLPLRSHVDAWLWTGRA